MPSSFQVVDESSVKVIELSVSDHVDSAAFDDLNTTLLGLFHPTGQTHWVIDLTNVNYFGSAMLGMMVNIRQQIKNIKGTLVLCNLSPNLLAIFKASALERLFQIARSRREAITWAS
jgi:anti-anti-sigma factor